MKSFSFQKDLFADDELWQRERVPKQHAADVSSTLRSKSATEDGSAEPGLCCGQDAGSTLSCGNGQKALSNGWRTALGSRKGFPFYLIFSRQCVR